MTRSQTTLKVTLITVCTVSLSITRSQTTVTVTLTIVLGISAIYYIINSTGTLILYRSQLPGYPVPVRGSRSAVAGARAADTADTFAAP